ncbi:synaptosomal-associated protein 29-like [Patiria miniata]|uniref:t-SNARE coiled-coil homology domain-containing protein n=1 Tax=Patiria miniata TaxID=46514 RepID=A0A914BEG6_PATMI|nr:synaptosomal-associated protein 29-like [Patiria miniata]
MSNVRRPKNPFDDDDDEPNDFVFVPRGPSRPQEKKYPYGDFGIDEDDQEKDDHDGAVSLQTQIEERQQNMLQSTNRSLGMMYEAENVGNETAHELLRQGEQLQNIDKKLDKMNTDIDTSKKHVTSLRSVFGGVVNYFSKKPEREKPEEQERAPSKLRTMVGDGPGAKKEEQDCMDHPAMRLRDPNAGRYNSRYDTSGFEETPSSSMRGTGYNSSRQQFEQKLDSNLDEMSSGLGRLKNLGLGLGDEIERQNDDIDRITGKTDKLDTRIEGVNTDIKKILRR